MRSILICPQGDLGEKLESAQLDQEGLTLSKILTEYPAAEVLRRMIRAWAPEVVFLSLLDPQAAEIVSSQIEKEFPRIQRIGLHTVNESATFRLGLRLRLREVLVAPFDQTEIGNVLAKIREHLEENPGSAAVASKVLSFVPAKAGVGASTLAANATWAFSRVQESDVLLTDFDLASGLLGFLFDKTHEHSLSDALALSHRLDADLWHTLTKKIGKIDLLLSDAPRLPEEVNGPRTRQLLEFVRRIYDIVCADLPDTFDDVSLSVLRESDRIFLVTTPELPAVRMARLKVLLFRKLNVEDKVELIVNRVKKGAKLDLEAIESSVGVPVFASFPCEYQDVTGSIQRGEHSTALARHADSMAAKILNKKLAPERRKRFIERFALIPARYAFE